MKGVIPVIIVIILVLIVGSMLFSRPAEIISCPAGQKSILVTDREKCGFDTIDRDGGSAGICTQFTCDDRSVSDRIAYCLLSAESSPTVIKRINAGETGSFPEQCNLFKTLGIPDSIKFRRWFEVTKNCNICVQDTAPKPNECETGQFRCDPSNQASAQACSLPTSENPYNHWVYSFTCGGGLGKCIKESPTSIMCKQICTFDVQCAINSYCGSGECRSKVPDTVPCISNTACISGLCDSGICKTRAGTNNGIGTSCDPGKIQTQEDCLQCGGTWKDPGLIGRGFTSLFGGKTEPQTCDLPLIDKSIGRVANAFAGAFMFGMVITAIIFVASMFIPAIGLFSRNPMIMLMLLGILTLLFFLGGIGK